MQDLQVNNCCNVKRNTSQSKPHKQKISRNHTPNTAEMIHLPGGSFLMGTASEEGFPDDGEGPVQEVTVDSFYIDPCTVTNNEF